MILKRPRYFCRVYVAPLAGARIEIGRRLNCSVILRVAPLAGARIEITMLSLSDLTKRLSLPSRERGLKFYRNPDQD